MMRKRHVYTILALVVIVLVFILWRISNQPIYGNDLDGIYKLIDSKPGFEGSVTEVIDIYDYGKYRFVAALSDNRPSIIEFKMDENGNYNWTRGQVAFNSGLEIFTLSMFNEEAQHIIVSIYSRGVDVKDYSFKVNSEIYNVTFDNGNRNVNWTILPSSSGGGYSFEWYKPEGY